MSVNLDKTLIVTLIDAEIARIDDKDFKSVEGLLGRKRLTNLRESLVSPAPTGAQLLAKHGGQWLATVREWIQRKAINGSDVTWGSHEVLRFSGSITVWDMEFLAALIASAAYTDQGTYVNRVQEGTV